MLLQGNDRKMGTDESGVDGNALVPAAITDTGCERELNEDRYAVIESPSGVVWLVCDGMGGATGGELAAQLAIEAIRRDLENHPARSPDVALKSAILEANRIIVLRRQNQAFSSMGTTIVAALFGGSEVIIGHVGDSRGYLIRDGAIQQLTTDHTYVQELVDRGEIRADEALSHPQAHILTRAIGSEPGLEVSQQKFWTWSVADSEPSDYLLLATDGLYSLVTEGEIANVVSHEPPQRACVKLVELARARGGFDNITLAVVPLNGQMRQEPPIGYNENTARAKQRSGRDKEKEPRTSLLRTFFLTFILCALSFLAVILGTFYLLKQ